MFSKFYRVGGITLAVRSDYPFAADTFHPKFNPFEVSEAGEDSVVIRHRFDEDAAIYLNSFDRIYLRPPWAIYRKENQCVYQWIEVVPPYKNYFRTVLTDLEHSYLDIYNDDWMKKKFLEGSLTSLTMFPTDQILLGRLLAFRNGCILHSLGVILDGNGYLFVGHSSAGKSTMAKLLSKEAVILCDDRNIIRQMDDQFMVYGTWSHGDVPDISAASAPLKGIFFLEKSSRNALLRIENNSVSIKTLLACLIRPLVTDNWWDLSMDLIARIIKSVPCQKLEFQRNGNISELLREYNTLTANGGSP
jgi:hypothetical protein